MNDSNLNNSSAQSRFSKYRRGSGYAAPIKKTLTLIRGIPGSGKTTIAMKMGVVHIEADMFFEKNGKYRFEGFKIKDAHAWCQSQVMYHLNQNNSVVVSNSFVKIEEMKPYVDFCKKYDASLHIIECNGNYKSVHEVPDSTIEHMKRNWEALPSNLKEYLVA